MCEICSKLIIKTVERPHWRHNDLTPLSSLSIVNFEYVIAGWEGIMEWKPHSQGDYLLFELQDDAGKLMHYKSKYCNPRISETIEKVFKNFSF